MEVLIVFGKDDPGWISDDCDGDGWGVAFVSNESDARLRIEAIGSGRIEVDVILITDERIRSHPIPSRPSLPTDKVREDFGNYRLAGVRFCQLAAKLELMERGVQVICGSHLYNSLDQEIQDAIRATGARLIPYDEITSVMESLIDE